MGKTGVEAERGPDGEEGPQGMAGMPGFMGETGNEGEQGPEGNPSLWSNAKSACARSATATMKLTDCDSHACRLETLYNGVWGSVCGEDWGPHSTRTMCKALGLPGSGRVKFNFVSGAMGTGSKGHVWLSKVQCKGSEGDVADCKHSGFGKHTCGHYNEVGLCCKPQPWGVDPSSIKVGVRKSKSKGPVPLKFQLPPGQVAAESSD